MTPQKKATPAKASPSLADRLRSKQEDKENEETPNTPETPEVSEDDNDNDGTSNENDTEVKESVVVLPEKGTDHQAEDVNNNDNFVNPDGVTHSGRVNPIDKTPADISSETPAETQKRYGISDEVPDDVHNNPNVTATRDNRDFQIPGGTHVHPDVARDNYNRMVGGRPSESGQVTMSSTQMVFAQEAPFDDKGIKNEQPENLA